ncbi:MAG: hypothetical protein V4490_01485, partial [Pseudomonadota bacterium]
MSDKEASNTIGLVIGLGGLIPIFLSVMYCYLKGKCPVHLIGIKGPNPPPHQPTESASNSIPHSGYLGAPGINAATPLLRGPQTTPAQQGPKAA